MGLLDCNVHWITTSEREHLLPLLEQTPNRNATLQALLERLKGNNGQDMALGGQPGMSCSQIPPLHTESLSLCFRH